MYLHDGDLYDDLYSLTGQESGIVIYGNEIIVTNWAQECPNGGMPILSPVGNIVIDWPHDEPLTVDEAYQVNDLRAMLEAGDYQVLSDDNGDIPALFGEQVGTATVIKDDAGNLLPTAGTCYHIGNALVIAPDGWN
jgi:hypothetical protein